MSLFAHQIDIVFVSNGHAMCLLFAREFAIETHQIDIVFACRLHVLHSNTLHHNVLTIHCIFACGLCCFQFVLHSNCKIDSVCDAFQLQCILNYKIDSVCVAFSLVLLR
eukprot:494301_1